MQGAFVAAAPEPALLARLPATTPPPAQHRGLGTGARLVSPCCTLQPRRWRPHPHTLAAPSPLATSSSRLGGSPPGPPFVPRANKSSYKYSGLANLASTVDVAAADGAVVVAKSSKKSKAGKLAGSVVKKNARRTNFAAGAEAVSAGRADLKVCGGGGCFCAGHMCSWVGKGVGSGGFDLLCHVHDGAAMHAQAPRCVCFRAACRVMLNQRWKAQGPLLRSTSACPVRLPVAGERRRARRP